MCFSRERKVIFVDYTVQEVLRFVDDNDVKFVKLAFCDIYGRLKNLNIFADELPVAFSRGMAFNAKGIDGYTGTKQDEIFLKPDPATLNVLPWRPHEGCVARLLCDLVKYDGTPFEGDTRYILKDAVAKLNELGYACDIGSSSEFYLFKTDELGNPTHIPQYYAGYLDASPLDKGENVRRDICLTLEEMEIIPKTSHHERGPGQNEVDFRKNYALSAADDMNTFRYVVKTIAERNGLYASFMPKPLENCNGSAQHIGFMLLQNGINIMKNADGSISDTAMSFMCGILRRVREICIFSNPLANSYERFGSGEAPSKICYALDDHSTLIRVNQEVGNGAKIVLRSPDGSSNQYITIALLLYAGIEGIKEKLTEKDVNIGQQLPMSLKEAIDIARDSEFIKSHIDKTIIDNYISQKTAEWEIYSKGGDAKQELLKHQFLTL